MASGPSKYKGHPKSEWASIRAAEVTTAQAAVAPAPEAPPPNAFTAPPDAIVAAMLPPEIDVQQNVSVKQYRDENLSDVRRGTFEGGAESGAELLQGVSRQQNAGMAQDASADRIATLENELSLLRQHVSKTTETDQAAVQNVRQPGYSETSPGLQRSIGGGVDVSSVPPRSPSIVGQGQTPAPIRINSEAPAVATPPRNLFSGQLKALDVYGKNGSIDDPIPGYRLYWFTDTGGTGTRLRQAQMSGWDFVDSDEIELQDNLVPGNNDLGSHVRKVVNANQVPPTYGYLMKKTRELDALHQAEAQIINDRMEQAMRAGTLGAAPGDGRYVAGQMPGSTLPKIEISQKSYR